jgi:hypothetical protein
MFLRPTSRVEEMAKARDYKKEYQYQGKPEQIANRSSRNKARRLMEDKLGKAAIAGKDVNHKDSNPKNNSAANLNVESKKKNRSRK